MNTLPKDRFRPADFAMLEQFALDALYCPDPQKRDKARENLQTTQITFSLREKKGYLKSRDEPVVPGDRAVLVHTISAVYQTNQAVVLRLTPGDKEFILCPSLERYGQTAVPEKVDAVILN